MIETVSFERPDIGEPEFLKQDAGKYEAFQRFLHLFRKLHHLFPDGGDELQKVFELRLESCDCLACHDAVEI